MQRDDSETIERAGKEIDGPTWTKRTVSRDLPLSEQIWLLIQRSDLRGPGELDGIQLERLAGLAESAKQIESAGPATVSMD